MASQSSNNSSNRQRSGGGKRSNSNNNRNRNRNNNNRNRNRNNNNRGGRKRKPAPKPTIAQKILSFLTFGLLGKPKKKTRPPKKRNTHSAKPTPAVKHKRRPRPEIDSARLYVGNLSYDAEDEELETLFHGAGNVITAEVVRNSTTQQSKGFAFVEMGSLAEAKRSVDILDDQDFMGRRLRISSARSDGPHDSDGEQQEPAPDSENAAVDE